MSEKQRAVYWVRNDLRLHDNAALDRFCAQANEGLIIWCASASFRRAGERRRAFILKTLQQFAVKLQTKGAAIFISMERATDVLTRLVQEHQVHAIYFTAEPAPEERAEEILLASLTKARCIPVEQGELLHPDDLPFVISNTPEVFTQFRTRVENSTRARPTLPEPVRWPAAWKGAPRAPAADFFAVGALLDHSQIYPGEAAGLARVHEYIWQRDRLRIYKETRNGMLEWNDSSKFSPWLSIGALSPRFIYAEVRRYEMERGPNESTYWMYFELLWRDYFRLIMKKKQAHVFGHYRELSHEEDQMFRRWTEARTGDDFIDANMRELNQTGWMSNRGRQNVASFLAKELRIPWQHGAQYFEHLLMDYDVSSNWGNWAYLAGAGQDPRNRRFNTQRQADLYDPDGHYRNKWRRSVGS